MSFQSFLLIFQSIQFFRRQEAEDDGLTAAFLYVSDDMKWGRDNNIARLGAVGERVQQFQEDARNPSRKSPDVRCAQNFSYWVFKTRAEMLEYFRGVYADLAEDGIFVVDLHDLHL